MIGVYRKYLAIGSATAALALAGCATVPAAPSSQFSLGRNAGGDPCSASSNWTDPKFGESYAKFADTYSVNCRGAASGAVARVRTFATVAERDAFSATLTCGPVRAVTLDGFDSAVARRCVDPGLGFVAVVVDANRGGMSYQIAAAPNAVGAGYQAARIVAGLDMPADATSDRQPIDVAALEAPTGNFASLDASAGNESLDAILARGTALNFRGLHADASRFLAASLSNLSDSESPVTRAALLLEAGLADSNIQFFGSAEKHFADAGAAIATLDATNQRVLRPKLQSYLGLHALNQRDFQSARRLLAPLVNGSSSTGGALSDPNTLVRLNTAAAGSGDVRSAISLGNEQDKRDAFLNTQAAWALSVAELSLGNVAGADAALDRAQERFDQLRDTLRAERTRDEGTMWLSARLARQRGRIEAARGDYDAAFRSFDSAIADLTRGALARSGTGTEPAIAEFQLERAALVARAGRPQAEVDAAYEKAVDALLLARDESAAFSTSALRPYLDRLAERMEAGDEAAAARYFQALQVRGEPGAARQISQLQTIVAADGVTGGMLRDLEELQRELTETSLLIAEARESGQPTAELDQRRADVQARYFDLDAKIQADARLSPVSTRPADLAEVQGALRDSEAYVRFNEIGDRIYGVLIEKGKAHAIRPQQDVNDVLLVSKRLRDSIDGGIEFGRVPEFSVTNAVVLYRILFGAVDQVLKSKSELVIDGGQVLGGLSPAVLITDPQGALRFTRQADKLDYTGIDFLAKRMSSSVAISPRSFISSRTLAPSKATQPLIGFASPEPLSSLSSPQGLIRVGPCLLAPAQIGELSNRFAPIPAREIQLAANALNIGTAPVISDAAFTDTEMLRRGASDGDLSNYKILHFATHGLTEGQFGCPEAPAALLTSLGQGGSDMLLSFDEIAKLRLDANLVVLSACETASAIGERALRLSGEAQPGATLEGLVRAFFSANARAVLATYWETSNRGDSEVFMQRFYESGRTADIATALNTAQRDLMSERDSSHPFFWGGFFVVGDTKNSMLAGAPTQVAAVTKR
ncbi:CHAT domain protein [Tsuneonella dongtanensis]|uniref:CHAT domain protein n=1 Tax=Tsuneonella dongtanensis TaxID=692370 RepID=A0A1B2AB70_9SPHN|nr:CHAT domain-containing protein [Tsuneonella dongtanensis]ANY19382.1 CHAT domain protein [Tsuneonella dongtanensis]